MQKTRKEIHITLGIIAFGLLSYLISFSFVNDFSNDSTDTLFHQDYIKRFNRSVPRAYDHWLMYARNKKCRLDTQAYEPIYRYKLF